MSQFKQVMSIFKFVFGILLTIIGVLFFHTGFTKILLGSSLRSVFTDVLIVVLMSFVPLIVGIFLCYNAVKRIIYRDHYNYDDNNRKDIERIDEYFTGVPVTHLTPPPQYGDLGNMPDEEVLTLLSQIS